MKGIYLAACLARHKGRDIMYQDIDPIYECEIGGDMLDVDLTGYDYIIASPPCNYYSRANYRRQTSKYALLTKHLLPETLKKVSITNKPFIVENVRNENLMKKEGIFEICERNNIYIYYVGRHTYFTNVLCNLECPQINDNVQFSQRYKSTDPSKYRQGGKNVHDVIEIWLDIIGA